MVRKIYYGIIILFAFAFGLLTCVGSIFTDMCGNEIKQEIVSPNKKLKAIVFIRDCGATTGKSTHISLLPYAQELRNTSGNIFTANRLGKSLIEIQWTGNSQLLIEHPAEATIFSKETNYEEVNIAYGEFQKQ